MPGPNSPYSALSADQAIVQSYDETYDRLRVDAAITIDNITLDVQLDQADDSVSIGNGTSLFTGTIVGPKNGLDVNVIGGAIDARLISSGLLRSVYNEILSVASGVTTTIVSYTSPGGSINYLQKIAYSGTNMAQFELLINGIVSDKQYSYFAGFNGEFIFNETLPGLLVPVGQVISLRVIHQRPTVGDFNGRIQVTEVA